MARQRRATLGEVERTVFTLGYGNRSPQELLELARAFDIELVVDVRRFPHTGREAFRQGRLREMLRAGGMEYRWLGELLGGYRSGGYEAYMGQRAFARGIEALEELAMARRTAVLCAERLPWRCHRRFIARALEARGWRVVHILEVDRTWSRRRPAQRSAKVNGT